MIVSSGLMLMPIDLALDAERDDALTDNDLTVRRSAPAPDTETEITSAPDINTISEDLALPPERAASTAFGTIIRGVIKPLIAVITAQYVIVAALVAGLAVTVAHHASHAINEKFSAIAAVLKRL